tara:strand:+ start:586 stop:1176 length:591 start_codon:yes stop_codon:yes gene_type:complete
MNNVATLTQLNVEEMTEKIRDLFYYREVFDGELPSSKFIGQANTLHEQLQDIDLQTKYLDLDVDLDSFDFYSRLHSLLNSSRELIHNLGLQYNIKGDRRDFIRLTDDDRILVKESKFSIPSNVQKEVYAHIAIKMMFDYVSKNEDELSSKIEESLDQKGLLQLGLLSLFNYNIFDRELKLKLVDLVRMDDNYLTPQ